LGGHVASVVAVPYDTSLADGRPCSWNRLRRRTRNAFGSLAAALDGAGLGSAGFDGAENDQVGPSHGRAAGRRGTGRSGATTLAG
ncbi:MAG: hypothetical protein ACQSGP_19750, partial [Frankia sp.]